MGGDVVGELGRAAFEAVVEDVVFGLEVAVEGAPRDAAAVGDFLDRDDVVLLSPEEQAKRVGDLVFGLLDSLGSVSHGAP